MLILKVLEFMFKASAAISSSRILHLTELYRAPRASITAATVVSVRRAVWDRKWALGCMPGRGGCCLCACPTALRRTGLATLPPE